MGPTSQCTAFSEVGRGIRQAVGVRPRDHNMGGGFGNMLSQFG